MNAERKKTLWMKWKQNVIVLNELNQMVWKGSRIYISHRPCVHLVIFKGKKVIFCWDHPEE